jgi:hypothetical protein
MSSPRVAALVCEGQTDVPVLRAVIQATWPEVDDVRCLQPELDEMERQKGRAGWNQVKAWCERHSDRLDEVLVPDLGDPIDLLIIAVDMDIAIHAGIADPPKNPGVYESPRLRATMSGWLTSNPVGRPPSAIVLSTPVMAIETWIIAAVYPKQRSPERIADPASWLADKGKLRRSPRDQKPWKELHLYRTFGANVATKLKQVRKACTEADRTIKLIEQRRDELDRAR